MKEHPSIRKSEQCAHKYVRRVRSIPGLDYYYLQCEKCNRVIYPMPQLQKLQDFAKEHQFMFVHDWILALMYARDDAPMIGITTFVKQLFLTLMEFAQRNKIPSENPGFRGYGFGPYAERIVYAINGLEAAGLIETAMRRGAIGEYYYLTDKGLKEAKKSFDKLIPSQQEEFRKERTKWHEWGVNGIEKYIYREYPEFAEESKVLDKVLHRRRVGR